MKRTNGAKGGPVPAEDSRQARPAKTCATAEAGSQKGISIAHCRLGDVEGAAMFSVRRPQRTELFNLNGLRSVRSILDIALNRERSKNILPPVLPSRLIMSSIRKQFRKGDQYEKK